MTSILPDIRFAGFGSYSRTSVERLLNKGFPVSHYPYGGDRERVGLVAITDEQKSRSRERYNWIDIEPGDPEYVYVMENIQNP